MTTILLLTMIVCGLMMMFGEMKCAIFVVIVSVVGCFSYRIWFVGEDLQSVSASALFCLALLPIGSYGAKRFIEIEDSISSK